MVVKFPRRGSLYTVSALRPFGRSGRWLAELPLEFVVALLLQTRVVPEVVVLRRSLDDDPLNIEAIDDPADHAESLGPRSVYGSKHFPLLEVRD